MLGLGRSAMASGTQFQAADQILIQFTDVKASGHLALHDTIAIKGSIGEENGQLWLAPADSRIASSGILAPDRVDGRRLPI